ncbi:MAG: TrmH family RNA methyltransferase [Chlamydiae bacterium]|nr:TrmH family RNA methyltransferase [Chlamydiota bacterium]
MFSGFTAAKFLSLPETQRHKKASEILREIHQGNKLLISLYNEICTWMEIIEIPWNYEQIADRFHFHLVKSGVSWQEHNLLIVREKDRVSSAPFLPIAIYLDNLRSAFNVGSILRTVEAFRLGSVYFSSLTPFTDNPKVQKTSMGTFDKVPCYQISSLEGLPRPFIGLETADFAPPIHTFTFPSSFTLFMGNEEYGLSKTTLQEIDCFIQIPLIGSKNSLNVASAFAISASNIRQQHSCKSLIAY